MRKRKDLKRVAKLGNQTILGDLKDQNSLKKTVSGVNIVYRLATIRSDWGYSWENYYQTNRIYKKEDYF